MKRIITCSCGIVEEMPLDELCRNAVAFSHSARTCRFTCRTCGRLACQVETVRGRPSVRSPRRIGTKPQVIDNVIVGAEPSRGVVLECGHVVHKKAR